MDQLPSLSRLDALGSLLAAADQLRDPIEQVRRALSGVRAQAQDCQWRSPAGRAAMTRLERTMVVAAETLRAAEELQRSVRAHHDTARRRELVARQAASSATEFVTGPVGPATRAAARWFG